MTDKLELKSSHEVVDTVNVADVESIFYCKPTDPDILTVLMKDGKRLYCDEVCPIDSLQEEPVSIWHNASEETPTQGSNILMVRKEEKDTNYPPIAGCFHGTNSRLDARNWSYYNGFCYNEIEPPVKWAYIDDILNLSNVERIRKNWKEPVSEDLEEAAKNYAYSCHTSKATGERIAACIYDFKAGAKWQKAHNWKPADGDDIPEIDMEVIVLIQDYSDDKDHLRVALAHRPRKYAKVWNSDLGEEQVVEIERYDKGCWNIPNVKWWLDIEKLPNMDD